MTPAMVADFLPIIMVLATIMALTGGFPVAFTLGGMAVIFAGIGELSGTATLSLSALPSRIFGTMTNDTLVAIPLFIFMGVVLDKSRIAEKLLSATSKALANWRGGFGIAVIFIGMLLAASTGIVGATVVMMGLIALPGLLQNGYSPRLASGAIAASGTLGQIIPPSIVLVILGDQISNAYQSAQLEAGNFSPDTISVADLFAGALLPGLMLVALYALYLLFAVSRMAPAKSVRSLQTDKIIHSGELIKAIAPPVLLIIAVLGSILGGIATTSEAASVGAMGALLMGLRGLGSFKALQAVVEDTAKLTAIIFAILIGATLFSLTFRSLGGDEVVASAFSTLPGGAPAALLSVMLVMFLLGFFLEFLEIVFVVVPLVAPVLLQMEMPDGTAMSPIWLGVLIAMNLQTSFLTPPFGFALFYLRGVAPKSVTTKDIYLGVAPFVALQLVALYLLWLFPALVTWLPGVLYAS